MKTGEFDVFDELLKDRFEFIVLLQQSMHFMMKLLFDVLDNKFHHIWHGILKSYFDWINCG
jgi:hypothetical protein